MAVYFSKMAATVIGPRSNSFVDLCRVPTHEAQWKLEIAGLCYRTVTVRQNKMNTVAADAD